MKLCGIYQIQNKVNNKIYIGSSIDIEQRWKTHRSELKSKHHHNSNLQNAWHEYGEENFVFEIIEIVEDKNNLIDREQHYMDLTTCYDINIGYNINPTAGNCLGVKRTEKEKIWLSRISSGEKSHFAKITEKDAISICKRIVSGETIRSIAKDYSIGIVSAIKSGSTWKHISKNYINYFPDKEMAARRKSKAMSSEEEEITAEYIFDLYTQFIRNVSKQFNVEKSFIKQSIDQYYNEEFYTENMQIVKTKDTNSKKDKPYLLSGLIRCLDCSQNYRGINERGKNKYICSGYNNKSSDCERFIIHEKAILDAIEKHFNSNIIDMNLVDFIEVRSKTVKIYYTDDTYSILSS